MEVSSAGGDLLDFLLPLAVASAVTSCCFVDCFCDFLVLYELMSKSGAKYFSIFSVKSEGPDAVELTGLGRGCSGTSRVEPVLLRIVISGSLARF